MSGSPVGQAGEEVAVPVEVDVVLPSTDDQGAKKRPSGRATVKIDYENEDEVCADGRVYKRVKNDYQKDDEVRMRIMCLEGLIWECVFYCGIHCRAREIKVVF